MNIIWCDIITLYEDYEYKIMAIYEDWSTAFGDFPRQDGFFFWRLTDPQSWLSEIR